MRLKTHLKDVSKKKRPIQVFSFILFLLGVGTVFAAAILICSILNKVTTTMRTEKNDKRGKFVPGMTFRAFLASILCMMLAALYTNYTAVIICESYTISESAIPIPAILAVLGLTLLVGLFALVFRLRLLTKAEIVCVTFATMMAVPMMTQGFWHRFLCMISATPRNQSYDYGDAFDDDLWPHGPNLLEGCFDAAAGAPSAPGAPLPSSTSASNVYWTAGFVEEGVEGGMLVISNSAASDMAYVEYAFPVDVTRQDSPQPAEPHLLTFLAKGEGVESETEVFVQAFSDDNPVPETLYRGSPRTRPTYLHKTGFGRLGGYGLIPARVCHSNLLVRIGLSGRGAVTLADPRFCSVAAQVVKEAKK